MTESNADWAGLIGHDVIYRPGHHIEGPEGGVISSCNDLYVFVRFGGAVNGVACEPGMLTFKQDGRSVETAWRAAKARRSRTRILG